MRKKGKKYFEDPDFGPKYKGDTAQDSIYFGDIPKGYPLPKNMEWFRPHEICSKSPEFVDDGADTNDVIQGALGDCWFIGALSVLATNDKLLRGNFDKSQNTDGLIDDDEAEAMTQGVYPPMFHYLRKFGMYVFRFYKNNSWRYVIIDDRLPCYKKNYGDKELVFGRCRSNNEFWVPLIEKAYAKIHQCYEALISGFIDDALTDMTAYAQTKIIFKKKGSSKVKMPNNGPKKKRSQQEEKDILWELLVRSNRNRSLMGASAFGPTGTEAEWPRGSFQPCGVLQGHAYSIIDVFEIEAEVLYKAPPNANPEGGEPAEEDPQDGELVTQMVKLVRLRNPWGKKEWNGPWSDGSDEIIDNMVKLNAYVRRMRSEDETLSDMALFSQDANDGTFLMNFDDWR